MTEEMTVETPKEQPKKPKEEMSQETIDSLISELEAANVTTPEKVQSTIAASRQAGQTANVLGETREELKGLKEEMVLLRTSQNQPDPSLDEFNQSVAPQVDIASEIEKGIDKAITKKEQQAAVANQLAAEKWNSITSDDNYTHVKEVWEAKTKDPTFVYRNPDPVKAYNETVIEFYKGLSIRAGEAMRKMQGGKPLTPAPTLESNQVPVGEEINLTDAQEKQKKLQEAVKKGHVPTEEEELAALDRVLGTTKPII